MIETDARSAEQSVALLDEVRREYASRGESLEMITDHGSEIYARNRDKDSESSHPFEGVSRRQPHRVDALRDQRPQSNGKIERFFQTDDKQRWRFDSLDEFLEFYNVVRPHMSLDWVRPETPNQAFESLLPTADDSAAMAVVVGGNHVTK